VIGVILVLGLYQALLGFGVLHRLGILQYS
jgi:hypothetical protein